MTRRGNLRRRAPVEVTRRGQDGFVAGAEALIFGVLIFVAGTIIAINAWAVIDAKMAVTAAAREGARAAVDEPQGTALQPVVAQAARAALGSQGKDVADLVGVPAVTGSIGRCQPITVEVRYRVAGIRVPWLGDLGARAIEVGSSHTEVVDPFRSGLEGEADACGF